MLAINVVLIFVCWHWAKICFDNDSPAAGWFNIFCSALNAATVANIEVIDALTSTNIRTAPGSGVI